jgi:anti-sigma factor RsiW
MDHKTAVRSLATERYILGELSPAERDEFEEHLSDCPECMEDVSTAEMFVANSRAVLRIKPQPACLRRRTAGLSLCACVLRASLRSLLY